MRLTEFVPPETVAEVSTSRWGTLSPRGLYFLPLVLMSLGGAIVGGWGWSSVVVVFTIGAGGAFVIGGLYTRHILLAAGAPSGSMIALVRGGRLWATPEASQHEDAFLLFGRDGVWIVDEISRSRRVIDLTDDWQFGVSAKGSMRSVGHRGRVCPAREQRWIRVFKP